MTREEAKAIAEKESVWVEDFGPALGSCDIDTLIDAIYDEHEKEIQDLRSVIETLELQASMYCGLWKKATKDNQCV